MSDPKYKKIGSLEIKVIEEAGELLQAISKSERFGHFEFHPRKNELNINRILDEMDDLREAMTAYRKFLIRLKRKELNGGRE